MGSEVTDFAERVKSEMPLCNSVYPLWNSV